MPLPRFRVGTLMIAVAVVAVWLCAWTMDAMFAVCLVCWAIFALILVAIFYRDRARRVPPLVPAGLAPSAWDKLRFALIVAVVTFVPGMTMPFALLGLFIFLVLGARLSGW